MEKLLTDDNIIDFEAAKTRLALAGAGPMDPDNPTWLQRYDVGTLFTVRKKNSPLDFLVYQFGIKSKTSKAILLLDENQQKIMVDPIRFCNVFDLYEILMTSEEYKILAEEYERGRQEVLKETQSTTSPRTKTTPRTKKTPKPKDISL